MKRIGTRLSVFLLLPMLVLLLAAASYGQGMSDRIRLGEEVNTQYNETKPLISPDGKILYFARQNAPMNVKGIRDAQDIYLSEYNGSTWSASRNLGAPLNDRYPNGVSSISPDGNTLLVLNAYSGLIVRNGASVATRGPNGWNVPEAIDIRSFYNKNDYVDYFLSSNEEEMILAIETELSYGDQDLYASFLLEDSTWAEPINMGPTINTDQAEFAPFLAADNRTLYFASYGHDSKGKCDIFMSRRLDETWQNWSTPVNLGPSVNSEGFEAYFSISASGKEAFFVSDYNTPDESRDIFQVPIPEEFRPDPVVLIRGKVYNKDNGQPMQASVLFRSIDHESAGLEERGVARSSADGTYSILLPSGHRYAYIAEVEDYMGLERYINLNYLKEYSELKQDLFLTKIDTAKAILLPSVTFDQFGGTLLEESYAELKHVANIMVQNPFMKIKVSSFSSTMFMDKSNLELSLIRARVVRDVLVREGIHPGRILARGYGSAEGDDVGNLIDITTSAKINPSLLNGRMIMEIITMDWKPPFMDRDKDGIADHLDNCPDRLGVEENRGCPSVAPEMEKILDMAMRTIEFDDKRGVLRPISYRALNQVYAFLQKYPSYKLKVSIHTDGEVPPTEALAITRKRSKAIEDYLLEQGLAYDRLITEALGNTKPIASNETLQGRDANDRLELFIIF